MKYHRHLCLNEIVLPPGEEWTEPSAGWSFLRVSHGAVYWLGPKLMKGLGEGDVAVVSPLVEGTIRASQLCEAKVHYFHFCPELLSEILTLAERYYFESNGGEKAPVRFLSAEHEVSRLFQKLIEDISRAGGLCQRCQMLLLVATVFADEMSLVKPPPSKNFSAHQRFKRLIQEMPDSELINHTPEQLAQLCNCSLRHFTRLFRKYFGASIRAKQTELRLLKARHLLSDGDVRILQVALDSGYRHLSLFSAMFKRYFGMTPSEWRKRAVKNVSRKPGKRLFSAALIVSLLAGDSLLTASTDTPTDVLSSPPGEEVRGESFFVTQLLPSRHWPAI